MFSFKKKTLDEAIQEVAEAWGEVKKAFHDAIKADLKYIDPVYRYRLRQKRKALKIIQDKIKALPLNIGSMFYELPILSAQFALVLHQPVHGLFYNQEPKGQVIEINRGSGTYKDLDVKIDGNKVHVQNNKSSTNIKVKRNFEEVEND